MKTNPPTNRLMSALNKPTTVQDHLDSIHQATPITAAARVKVIAANKDGLDPAEVLTILESALTREVRTTPQRRAVIQACKQAIKRLQPKGKAKPTAITAEVMANPKDILASAKAALETLRSSLIGHEEEFLRQTLPDRVKIGLHCLKAHEAFCIKSTAKRGALKGTKKLVTRDEQIPEGFEGWLITECPWLKKPTAYKYMTAFKGLGLDSTATEKQVDTELQKLAAGLPNLSLKALCDAAIEAINPPAPPPPRLEQQEFDFLRQSLSAFREETESLCRLKEKLDAYPDFKRAATARLYSALVELTGTDWAPSDHPDALATIDPDAITI